MEALIIRPGRPARLEYVSNYADPAARRGEVIIRVHLAGICATDLEILRGYLGFAGVPGHEFVGTVVTGSEQLQGRRVVAEINCACGACDMCNRGMPRHCRRRTVLGIDGRDGAFAGLVSVPERNCHLVPDEIIDDQAVFVEPLAAAVQVIKLQPIDRSMNVVVLGAGRLGLLVAQVLKLQGCGLRVVGRNRETLAVCERHGIQVTELPDLVPEPVHDVVVDCTGSVEGLRLAMEMCRPLGTIVLKSTYAEPAKIDLAPLVINEIRVVGSRCGPFLEALDLLRGRKVAVEEMISQTYPLWQGSEAFAAAGLPGNIKVLLRPGTS